LNINFYNIPETENPGTIAARVTAVHRDRFEIVTEYGFSHARMKFALERLPRYSSVSSPMRVCSSLSVKMRTCAVLSQSPVKE